MLKYLRIKNLAVIDDINVEFKNGLNILTGETGAGKSILLDGIKFVGGDRFDKTLIRTGGKKVIAEAVFKFEKPMKVLKEHFDDDDDLKEIIVRRELYKSGRNKLFINNKKFKLSYLKSISDNFYNIYGQSDHKFLLDNDNQLNFLDMMGDNLNITKKIQKLSKSISEKQNKIKELEQKELEKNQREEYLNYVISEIEEVDFKDGIEKELLEKRKVFQDADEIFNTIRETLDLSYEGETSIIDLLASIEKNFERLSRYKKDWENFHDKVSEFMSVIEDASYQLRDFIENFEYSPEELEETENKLAKIEQLKRKYGDTEKKIMEFYGKAKNELDLLQSIDLEKSEQKEELDKLKKEYNELAKKLTEKRNRTSKELEKNIIDQLNDLEMKKADFKVQFNEVEENFDKRGKEFIEFYFTANPGEELKPLSKIASGGELSRMMLALKMVAKNRAREVYIFDEIDSGVGGKTAEKVGEKLKELSDGVQILCITHFPQVAAYADNHYKVDKYERDGRTYTKINLLKGEEKVDEICRMMSGSKISTSIRQSAKQLLEKSNKK